MSAFHNLIKTRKPSQPAVHDARRRANQTPRIAAAEATADAAMLLPPVGCLLQWCGTADPAGGKWMICDGRELPVQEYPDLYAVIGIMYNSPAPAPGFFRIPDTRGRAKVGTGTGSGLTARGLGSKFGAETHVLTNAQMPTHNHYSTTLSQTHSHTVSTDAHDHGGSTGNVNLNHNHSYDRDNASGEIVAGGTGAVVQGAEGDVSSVGTGNALGNHAHSIPNNSPGGSTNAVTHGHGIQNDGEYEPHNNVQPSIAFHDIIRVAV